MKKILFCASSLSQTHTGAAVFAQLFIEWAGERSIDVDIISPEENNLFDTIPFVKHRKVFTKIPILQSYHRSFIYYKTVKQQISELQRGNQTYDLIFFNSTIESLHTAKLVHEVPVWAFLHDENFMRDYMKKPSWKRKVYRRMMNRHEGKAIKSLDKVVTNSKYMKQSIVDIYEKHPIDVEYSYFRSYDLPGSEIITSIGDSICILFIKHDADRGGLSLLFNTIAKLEGRNISLHLVGVDLSYLEKYLPLINKIKYRIDPYLTRDELHEVFLNTDIFCVPSFSEALGLGNIEALQYSKPVLVLDIPVMRELVRIEPMYFVSSADELASTLEEIIDNPDLRALKREAGSKFINEHISKESVFRSWDRIFR